MAAYVIAGEGRFGERGAKVGELVLWQGDGAAIRFGNEGREPLEVLVLGGTPAEGPLVFHGPFVMNSVEQVRAAEVAYRTGRMGELEDA
jgi:redox-sensitive bicupin YhaK (pirin superfamily)